MTLKEIWSGKKADTQSQADARPPAKAEVTKGPEKPAGSRYYEHDGALRAYANRAMVLAFLCVPTTLVAVGLAAYVRLQSPTVIRVDANGESKVLGATADKPMSTATQGPNAATSDLERKALVRRFLERYLDFTPETIDRNWADALNMMTGNLRRATLAAIQKDSTVDKVNDGQITSIFRLSGPIEAAKDDPLTFVVFGVKDVHRITDHQEAREKLVGEYRVRLISERRTEDNPSGLMVAEYSERLIDGERRNAILESADDTK